jgi:hypothetical protein
MKTIAFLLTASLLMLVTPLYADECSYDCNGTGWTLYLGPDQLSWPNGELTEEQCQEMLEEIEPQAPPFADLKCVEEPTKRESIKWTH